MSFDIDPKEHHRRYLLSHPESESLFEVFSQNEAEHAMLQGPCDDVTGDVYFENLFKAESLEKYMEIDENKNG